MPAGRKRDIGARERLLDAAFTLVSAQASANVPVDDIARAARVGKQTIYRWWPSKSELILEALLERTLEQTPFPDTDNAESDFRCHLRGVVGLFNSPAGPVIKDLLAGAQSDPGLAEQFVKRFWDPAAVWFGLGSIARSPRARHAPTWTRTQCSMPSTESCGYA